MPKNGWTTAGCLTDMGGQWSIAWRVLDAQFWGVPQRRRRIALIADFGGLTAPEILFERKSLSGGSAAGRTERESASIDPEDRVGTAMYDARGNGDGRVVPTITGDHNNRITDYSSVIVQSAGFCGGNSVTAAGTGYQLEQTPALTTAKPLDVVYALDRAAFNQGENAQYDFKVSDDGINSTLVSKGPSAICIQGNCIDRAETAGCNGKGWTEDVSYTLNTIDRHAVAFAIGNGQSDNTGLHEFPGALNCMHDQQAVLARVKRKWIVRRLTPLECERLQGYPDSWTDIGSWTDLHGKIRESADSARYKALGNSIALPPWVFVLSRLTLACGAECTMGSLFDGIGGFPLIWERLNGAGSCLWASEIDEFAIAVTKKRFGSEAVSESRKEA